MARCKNVSGPAASAGGSPGGDGGDDPPRRLSATEKGKGKKLATKKRKASDREAEVAEAVAAAAEAAERGGRLGALRIGADLTPRHRRAVLEAEARHGSPPGTIMIEDSVSGSTSQIQLRRTRTQRQRLRPKQRVLQRDSSRSSPLGGRLALVPRPLLGLVRRASLPPLLVLLQHEALQLPARGFTETLLLCQLGRSSSCGLFLFPLGF